MVNVEAWKQQQIGSSVEAKENLFDVLGVPKTADTIAVGSHLAI